jgi:hypothetical protein
MPLQGAHGPMERQAKLEEEQHVAQQALQTVVDLRFEQRVP